VPSRTADIVSMFRLFATPRIYPSQALDFTRRFSRGSRFWGWRLVLYLCSQIETCIPPELDGALAGESVSVGGRNNRVGEEDCHENDRKDTWISRRLCYCLVGDRSSRGARRERSSHVVQKGRGRILQVVHSRNLLPGRMGVPPLNAALHMTTTFSLTGRDDGQSIAVWWGCKEAEAMEFRRPTIQV